jgi:hypothetical protein
MLLLSPPNRNGSARQTIMSLPGPNPRFAAVRRSVGNEGEADGRWTAEACLLRPNGSHVYLFGHLERTNLAPADEGLCDRSLGVRL